MITWAGVLNHLWQSTLFAAIAGLLNIALRGNQARVRYLIWLTASLKFLVPFALLISIGERVEWRGAAMVERPTTVVVMEHLGQPLSRFTAALPVPVQGSPWPAVLSLVWFCGTGSVLIFSLVRWRRIHSALRTANPLSMGLPIRVLQATSTFEPGVFGIFRPVLLLPDGFAERLTPAQLEAIVAHELCHVRHGDNLTAAIHMVVEAAFWFHPLVWWIGGRLIEERERACDECVLTSGSKPHIYAESILQVCRFYVESPLACAAGVTGADLKKRIEWIMGARIGRGLSSARRWILGVAGIASVAVPLVFGVVSGPLMHGQSADPSMYQGPGFDVASIKPSDPGQRGSGIPPASGGRFRAVNVTTRELIGYAYHTNNRSRMPGGPAWLDSERFDINAKAEGNFGDEKARPMVLKLLRDRFGLKFHHETKQMSAYVMTVAKGGPKFKISDSCVPASDQKQPCGGFRVYKRSFVGGQQVSAADLAEVLEALLDEPVLDHTGIKGVFAIQLQWTPDDRTPMKADAGVGPVSSDSPSLFVAMQEQLGLRLDLQKASVDVVVIESAQRPTDNNANYNEAPIAMEKKASGRSTEQSSTVQPQRQADAKPAFDVASMKSGSPESNT